MRRWSDPFTGWFLRVAAAGWLPARWFEPNLPNEASRAARTGRLKLEVVSHCWQYGHFLMYQLSSLVRCPPQRADVLMTVYHSPEDTGTLNVLDFFGGLTVPGVTWNWQPLPRWSLFRRAIGRNRSALTSDADWIWFTDCDLMFRDGCLDGTADALQGRREALLFPRNEYCTSLLTEESAMLNMDPRRPQVVDIDVAEFTRRRRSRATGPLQITHGDVARACGYCNALAYYQRPAERWRKAYEDRAFRWLLRTEGTPLDIPGVYRIRHVDKGRYAGGTLATGVRSGIRRLESWLQELRQK